VVCLDDVWQKKVDLYSSSAQSRVVVWSSSSIADGPYKVWLRRSTSSVVGEYLSLDEVDIWGTIASPSSARLP
jgi:hypothetical protein